MNPRQSDISDLFLQIVQSEEKIKQRFEVLKKVNVTIQEHHDNIKSTQYETGVLRGKINSVNKKIVQTKMHKEWLCTRDEILKQQLAECRREKENTRTEIDEKRKHYSASREKFVEECDVVIKEHATICFGDKQPYEENCKEELKQTTEEHKMVLKDLEDHQLREAKVKILQEKKKIIEEGIEKKQKQKEDLLNKLPSLSNDIRNLEATKHRITKKTSTDPEFRCVLQEIEASREECANLSRDHQYLAKELHELQRKVQSVPLVNKANNLSGNSKPSNAWTISTQHNKNYLTRPNQGKKVFQYRRSAPPSNSIATVTNTGNSSAITSRENNVTSLHDDIFTSQVCDESDDMYLGSPSSFNFFDNDEEFSSKVRKIN